MCPNGQMCDTNRSPPTCVTQVMPIDAHPMPDVMPDGPGPCGVCSGATPYCDLGTSQCRACQKDSECASDVCSESTGKCVEAAMALYVATNGNDANACTKAAPCALPSRAAGLLDATHTTIKVADGTYTDTILTTGASYLISGEGNTKYGARINYLAGITGKDHTIEIQGGTVTVEGLTFANAAQESVRVQSGGAGGATATLWRVQILGSTVGNLDTATSTVTVFDSKIAGGQGTEAAVHINGGRLTMTRSQVGNNLGGGIDVFNGASFDVSNCFIYGNQTNGGFLQVGAAPGMARFEFNTVADNSVAAGGAIAGANCAVALAFESSIFSNNGPAPQFGAACTATYSLFTDAPPPGTGNLMGAAGFVAGDYHLAAGSPAIDHADPGTSIKIDIDGDVRPKGAGYDIGADEH
jgi:parallel beta helix pectate lyase-like protein